MDACLPSQNSAISKTREEQGGKVRPRSHRTQRCLQMFACKKWNELLAVGVFTQRCRQDQRICMQICAQMCFLVLCELGLKTRECLNSRVVWSLALFRKCWDRWDWKQEWASRVGWNSSESVPVPPDQHPGPLPAWFWSTPVLLTSYPARWRELGFTKK